MNISLREGGKKLEREDKELYPLVIDAKERGRKRPEVRSCADHSEREGAGNNE